MKKIHFLFIVLVVLIGCQSNGFINKTGQTVQLGSQSSVEVFKQIDKAWAERDYEKLKTMIHSEGKFTNADGEVFNTSSEFIDWIEKSYQESVSSGQSFGWETNFAFAVKVTKGENQDNDDGDYVNARFTAESDGTVYDEWYYIVDNKLKSWEQSSQAKPKSAGQLFGKKSNDIIGDQSSVDLVLEFVELLNKQEFDKAKGLLDDEMSISYAGGYFVKGREQVIETFRKSHSKGQYTYRPVWGSATKNTNAKNANRVVNVFDVLVKSGRKIDVQNMMLATYVKDNKIKGMWVHSRSFNPDEYKAVLSDAKKGNFLKRD